MEFLFEVKAPLVKKDYQTPTPAAAPLLMCFFGPFFFTLKPFLLSTLVQPGPRTRVTPLSDFSLLFPPMTITIFTTPLFLGKLSSSFNAFPLDPNCLLWMVVPVFWTYTLLFPQFGIYDSYFGSKPSCPFLFFSGVTNAFLLFSPFLWLFFPWSSIH